MQTFFLTILVIVLLGTAWYVIKTFPADTFDFVASATSSSTPTVQQTNGKRVAADVVSAYDGNSLSKNRVRISSVRASYYGSPVSSMFISVLGPGDSIVDLTGWEIRTNNGSFRFPQVAERYEPHRIITLYDINIKYGDSVSVRFGENSPIGVSFRVNACTNADAHFSGYERCVDALREQDSSRKEIRVYTGIAHALNQNHDRIQLFNTNGELVDEYFY